MKKVNIATLKQSLSAYIHLVENGDEIVITSHRHPVARLVREVTAAEVLGCRPPSRSVQELRKVKGIKLAGNPSGVEVLLADRSSR